MDRSLAQEQIALGVLGRVEAWKDGRPLPVGHARQRAVLAILMLNCNRPVSVTSLVDRVWGDPATSSAQASIYGYISRLRKILSPLSHGEPTVQLARVEAGGYVLHADRSCIDAERFRNLVAAARTASDPATAAELFHQAMALWRGPALDGVHSPWLDRMRGDLHNLRTAALLDYHSRLISLDRPGDLLEILEQTLRERPFDEAVTRALMRALQLTGRQAEALNVFERVRRYLASELGIDPDPETLELYQMVLRGQRPKTSRPAATPGIFTICPAQLPQSVVDFIGRESQCKELERLLVSAASVSTRIIVVHGAPGVGKTALALYSCQRALDNFPDGQLYLNLYGHRAGQQPLDPSAALTRLLRSLGVRSEDLPAHIEEQEALYRTLVAGKRLLIFLDDVANSDQVLPLIPGGASSAVVITSRNVLPAMLVSHGVRRVSLDSFTPDESRELLARIVGEERCRAEPKAADALSRLCGGLPLAVSLVAAKAAGRPWDSLTELSRRLERDDRRVELIRVDPASPNPVKEAFDLSYNALPAPLQVFFRRISQIPGPDFSIATAAAVTQRSIGESECALDQLSIAHLVEPSGQRRYHFHELIRVYARQRNTDEDGVR